MTDILMPRLSDSMEEGTILKWLVEDGAEVARGQEIAEIETDKATMTFEADADGPLHLVAGEGDTLAIGALIARIGGDASEGAPAAAAAPAAAHAGGATAVPEAPAAVAAPPSAPAEQVATAERATADGNGRVKASPVARRLAAEAGLDLARLTGSGPGGRIVKADVEAAARAPQEVPEPDAAAAGAEPTTAAAPTAAPSPAPAPAPARGDGDTGRGTVTVEELSRVQSLVARRMAESRATVPDFTLTTDVDMTAAVELRAQLKAAAGGEQPVPSYNDMVVKASALALREHPRANGSYKDGHFELYSRVNVGVAVAAENALIVPTIFDADTKSLGRIAQDTRAVAARVRDGQVTPPELSSGTFTVSNLGMYGVTHFTAVINPPQAAILAVGALQERPAVRDGRLVTQQVMTVTLACDHRILYGADAAQFLASIKAALEAPLRLAF
jgi:pyruvate dehydrogenase E2 component (dihydrolipoamide acetyltransferase)